MFFLAVNGKTTGPYSLDQVSVFANSHQFGIGTMICNTSDRKWMPLESVIPNPNTPLQQQPISHIQQSAVNLIPSSSPPLATPAPFISPPHSFMRAPNPNSQSQYPIFHSSNNLQGLLVQQSLQSERDQYKKQCEEMKRKAYFMSHFM